MTRRVAGLAGGPAAVLVALLGFVALVVGDAFVLDEPTPRGDDLIYELMAQDPSAPHTFPFAYRVAVPWLVHVLPFDSTVSFSLLAWLCSAGAGAFLALTMERLGVRRPLAMTLAVLFACSPVLLVASLRQGRNPDPFTALVLCAGAWAIVSRRPRALGAIMLAGALNRESALVLAPWAYAYWARGPIDRRELRAVVLAALPAVVAYVALRLVVPTAGNTYGAFLDTVRRSLDDGFANARRIAYVAGPLWLGWLVELRSSRYARAGLVVVAFCLVAFGFANDWGRVAFVLAPVLWVSGAMAIDGRRRLTVAAVVLLVLMDVSYAVYMDLFGVRTGIIETGPPPYPVQ